MSGKDSDFTIRDATLSDLHALTRLSRKTFTDKFGDAYPPEDLSGFLDQSHSEAYYRTALSDPETLVRVAETKDGVLAAYLLCSPLTLPAARALPGALELKRIYVDAPLQGRGLGSIFIDQAIGWARARGAPELYLSVFSENEGARKLYEKYGWEKVDEFIFPVGNTKDLEFLMRLSL
ncbi:MAG TPA: GNAT family N-acetyltransferase [Hyphomonas sp.]|nr:GNAT family N-acetyltransferase [Hyphomonas sp.]